MAISAPLGVQFDPKLLEQKPWPQVGSVSFVCDVSSSSTGTHMWGLLKEGGCMWVLGFLLPQIEVSAISHV